MTHLALPAPKPLLTWAELNPEQQEAARVHEYNVVLNSLTEYGHDYGVDAIDEGLARARNECERLRTPWFYGQYIDEYVGDLLMQDVSSTIQQWLFRNPALPRAISDARLPL